jgi:hypothetical protein
LGRYDLEIGSGKRLAGSGAANGHLYDCMICTLRKEKITNKLFTALEAIGSGSKKNFDVATRGCAMIKIKPQTVHATRYSSTTQVARSFLRMHKE